MSSRVLRHLHLISILSILTFVACSDSSPDVSTGADEPPRVEVEEFAYKELPDGDRVLTGYLYNASSEAIPHADVQVSLYDSSNRRVESMIIPVRDIGAGERKSFREAVRSKADIRAAQARAVLIR